MNEQEMIQKNIEKQIGNLIVQICIKDALIERLTAELNSLKIKLGDLPESVPAIRPESGSNGGIARR